MEFTVPGSGPTEQTLLAALQLTGSVLLCFAVLGLPWSLLTRLHAAQPWPTLRRSRPLLLTLPALLLALSHESSVLDSLGQVAQAQQLLTVGEQALVLAYLAAAGTLYYRPAPGSVWGCAAVLCAVPLLLGLQGLWPAGAAFQPGPLPALLACSLGSWLRLLLAHLPLRQRRQALA